MVMNNYHQPQAPLLQPSYYLTGYHLDMVDKLMELERVPKPVDPAFFIGKRMVYNPKDGVIQIPPRSSAQIADRMYIRSQTHNSRKRHARSIRRRRKNGDETLWPTMLHYTPHYRAEFACMETESDVGNYIVWRCTEFFDGNILFVVPVQNQQFRIKVLTNDAYYGHKFVTESFPTFRWDMYPMANDMYTYIVATYQ